MKIIIFYNSKFGNGREVCQYMAKGFEKEKNEAKTFSIQDTNPKQIGEADLYIFSSSTHIGNAPFKTRRFLKRLKKQTGAKYVIVTTNMQPQGAKTLRTMSDILAEKGYKEATTPLALKVEGMKGPLEKQYQTKVDEYIKKLISLK